MSFSSLPKIFAKLVNMSYVYDSDIVDSYLYSSKFFIDYYIYFIIYTPLCFYFVCVYNAG